MAPVCPHRWAGQRNQHVLRTSLPLSSHLDYGETSGRNWEYQSTYKPVDNGFPCSHWMVSTKQTSVERYPPTPQISSTGKDFTDQRWGKTSPSLSLSLVIGSGSSPMTSVSPRIARNSLIDTLDHSKYCKESAMSCTTLICNSIAALHPPFMFHASNLSNLVPWSKKFLHTPWIRRTAHLHC